MDRLILSPFFLLVFLQDYFMRGFGVPRLSTPAGAPLWVRLFASAGQDPLQSRNMKFCHVIIPILVYLGGYYLLTTRPQFRSDPMVELNAASAPILHELIQTKFFRMIRLNLNQECQLGHMNKICKSKSCSVCRCDEKDIPLFWSSTDRVHSHSKGKDLWSAERGKETGWVWHVEDIENDRGEYFDIFTNVEAFTNYNGSYIWELIYGDNCFHAHNNYHQLCGEEKTLYTVISGLHTSISTHLSRFYRDTPAAPHPLAALPEQPAFYFNHAEYRRRVLAHPDRIKNLLFLYRLLAKAINQAAPYLQKELHINSDNISEDLKARRLLEQLLRKIEPYDLSPKEKEDLKFFTPDNPKVRQIQKYIHNISSILNCVECEKCRLFGKMQTYGVGTALKILLGYPTPYKRNEIVALFNVFNKISMSVDTYYQNRQEIVPLGYETVNSQYLLWYTLAGSGLAVVLVVLWLTGKGEGGKGEGEGEKRE